MKKIASLFQRNYDGDGLVRNEVVPGSEWVINGEGVATRKFDGSCAMIREGLLYKRYDAKNGKTPPPGFEPSQAPDPVTGHWPGWIRVDNRPEDKYFLEAITSHPLPIADGTYELCGPKVQGNPEGLPAHVLIKHGEWLLDDAPRDFDPIKEYLRGKDIEGIVWHHPDGRMVKIKRKDFFRKSTLVSP